MAAQADSNGEITEVFTSKLEDFKRISNEIWKNPERSFKEYHASAMLSDFFENEGFEVQRKYVSETGFRAVYASVNPSAGDADDKGLNVCFICHYDSVADIGHAAGHNLQTTASIAAALAIKKCIEKNIVKGQVTVLGTAGEDSGHGTKIDMLNAGVFNDIDFCMMVTPYNQNILYPRYYHLAVVAVTYKGKASHASACPWEGRNALDAAVSCYNNVALLRQQFKPKWNINAVISDGGYQPNVIPHCSQLKFWLRAPEQTDLVLMQMKCNACFVAAAKATGCEAHFEFEDKPNYAVLPNATIGEIFHHKAQELEVLFCEDPEITEAHIGSSDMGNVSQTVPTINPAINIGTAVPLHSDMFAEASGTDAALANILRAAKALALTACQVMTTPTMMEYVRSENTRLKHSTSEGRMRDIALSEEP